MKDLNKSKQFTGLFCTQDEFINANKRGAIFVTNFFYKNHLELMQYFFIMDGYTLQDLYSIYSTGSTQPSRFIPTDIYLLLISDSLNNVTNKVQNKEDILDVLDAIYPGIIIQDIVEYNEKMVVKFLKYRKILKKMGYSPEIRRKFRMKQKN